MPIPAGEKMFWRSGFAPDYSADQAPAAERRIERATNARQVGPLGGIRTLNRVRSFLGQACFPSDPYSVPFGASANLL